MLNKVVFIDFTSSDIPSSYFNRIIKRFKKHVFISRDNSRILKEVSDADILLVKIFTRIDKEILDAAKSCKLINVCSTAYDAIDARYAHLKKIPVCNLGGYSTEAVAEFFFAALFEHIRELEKAKVQARNENYDFMPFMGTELYGKTLGILGAGKIGGRIAEIGLGIGMKVIYYSRVKKTHIEKLGAVKKPLIYILRKSDYLSLNLVLNNETKLILDKKNLVNIKKDSILISLAPPPLIDQEEIMKKANRGDFTYIFDHSDDMDKDLVKKFLKSRNCFVYPPVAFRTTEANTTRWETFTSNVEYFIQGKLQNIVN